jgi:cholesterol oxidase
MPVWRLGGPVSGGSSLPVGKRMGMNDDVEGLSQGRLEVHPYGEPLPLVGPRPSLRFHEHLAGFVSEMAGPDADFESAAALGRASGHSLALDLSMTYDDLTAVLSDTGVEARVTGRVELPSVSATPLEVVAGRFVLLVPDPGHVETDNMIYHLDLKAEGGRRLSLDGFKIVHHGPAPRAWRDTTTLYVTVKELPEDGEAVDRGRGVVRISMASFRRMVASMEIVHVPHRRERERYRFEFLSRFAGALWPFYGGSLNETARFPSPPPEPPALPTPNGRSPDVVRWCDPAGAWHDQIVPGACSRLIRYWGGDKGPVMLAAGFAMSATSYALESNSPSLVAYLLEREFDVWLFDYRAGIDLPSAWSSGTIDEIATIDWPRAVDEVRRISGSPDVQAFGHCVGSVSLLMALLSGTQGVRAAVCAQFTVHPVTSTLNKVKARLGLGTAMADLGMASLKPDSAPGLADTALDLALRPVPVPHGERCGLAVCRWINAIYGCTHVHDQLDDATHREIASLFGVGNLDGLRHLVLILQRGMAVDASGLDRYLPQVARLDLPIHFVAGTRNHIFHPQGTERTLNWLRQAHGEEKSDRNYSVTYLDDYGHLDALIGRDASTEVFPVIVDHLDRWA